MVIPNPLLDPLKSILVYNRRRIYIDNVYFRLHYVWTVIILLAFAILVTSKIYVGDPINCMSSGDVKDIVKQYCFIHSTYTKGKFDKKGGWIYEPVKDLEIYPGVRPGVEGDTIRYHTYYQWVWCVLVIQAVAFYFPHWVWEKLERGTCLMLVGDLNLPMLPDEKKVKHRRKILLYFRRNKGYHDYYWKCHAGCELLNFFNILLQIWATDFFMDNAFTSYGLQVFYITQTKPYMRDDALARVFPTVTACRLQTGGVAFGKVQHDILCILPINILNEKIYIFLWFWFLLVLFFSLLCLVYRALTVSPFVRKIMLRRRVRGKESTECVDSLCEANEYGEWFLLYKLSQNMDTVTFGDLVQDLDQALKKWDTVKHLDEEMHLEASAPPPSTVHTPVHARELI